MAELTSASLGMNSRAAALADAMLGEASALRVAASTLPSGARVIDCGVQVAGGYEAGRRLAEICMGGLGRVDLVPTEFGDFRLPGVQVRTDHPAVSCLGAQYAGWAVKPEGFFAMGSGPLRAIARSEALYEELAYAEAAEGRGVLVLEGRDLPGEPVVAYLAERSGVRSEELYLLVAPTASLAGGVQISARVVETCLHKLHALGFDVTRIVSGYGTAPIAPVAKNDLRAIGRTNDCVLYGGTVHLTVQAEDEELEALAPQVPSSASRDYGTPFYETFKRYDGDFYKVDPHLFSPAEVLLTNVASGRTFRAGSLNPGVLRESLLG